MRVLYDIELDKIRPSVLNRKYTTIKQAAFAYKKSEEISRKFVLSAIKDSKMRTVVLTNGQVLIDKIMLHKALYPEKISKWPIWCRAYTGCYKAGQRIEFLK